MRSSYEKRQTGMLILMCAQLMEALVRYGPDGANPAVNMSGCCRMEYGWCPCS